MTGRPALFVDRDGVVNREQGYVWRPGDFHFEPAFLRLAATAAAAQWPIVVITNQGGVGKGLYTLADVAVLHKQLTEKLQNLGVTNLHILQCPHHPTTSHCLCRKPSTLLFQRAMALGGYEAKLSWMVGDRVRDVIPARALGMHTALITTHTSEEGPTDAADYRFDSIDHCADFLVPLITQHE